jgi:hypothetical protein
MAVLYWDLPCAVILAGSLAGTGGDRSAQDSHRARREFVQRLLTHPFCGGSARQSVGAFAVKRTMAALRRRMQLGEVSAPSVAPFNDRLA